MDIRINGLFVELMKYASERSIVCMYSRYHKKWESWECFVPSFSTIQGWSFVETVWQLSVVFDIHDALISIMFRDKVSC